MRMFESGRSALNVLFMTAFLLLGTGGFAEQASAQSVVCAGTETATYNPPLTNTQQEEQVTATTSYSPCVVLGVSGISSGTAYSNPPIRDLSCTALLGGGPSIRIINWSNGLSSTLSYTSNVNSVNGLLVVTMTGNISAGLFKGQSAVGVVTVNNLSQADFLTACSGSGVVSLSGPSTLTIAPPL